MASNVVKAIHRIECRGETSSIYGTIHHQITRRYQHRFDEKIQPWSFWNSGKDLYVEKYDGRTINVGNMGVEFSGSIEIVFWSSFIQHFIEDDIHELVSLTINLCLEKQISPTKPLNETRVMLKQMAANLFHNMARADQLMKGKGYPNKIAPVSIDQYVEWSDSFVDQLVDLELKTETFLVKINRSLTKHEAVKTAVTLAFGASITLFVQYLLSVISSAAQK